MSIDIYYVYIDSYSIYIELGIVYIGNLVFPDVAEKNKSGLLHNSNLKHVLVIVDNPNTG